MEVKHRKHAPPGRQNETREKSLEGAMYESTIQPRPQLQYQLGTMYNAPLSYKTGDYEGTTYINCTLLYSLYDFGISAIGPDTICMQLCTLQCYAYLKQGPSDAAKVVW